MKYRKSSLFLRGGLMKFQRKGTVPSTNCGPRGCTAKFTELFNTQGDVAYQKVGRRDLKETPEFESLQSWLSSEDAKKYENDPYATFTYAASKRFENMLDPKNNQLRTDGSFGGQGAAMNFWNLMQGLKKAKIYDPKDLSKLQSWISQQGDIKKKINTGYYTGFNIPSPPKDYSNDEIMNILNSFQKNISIPSFGGMYNFYQTQQPESEESTFSMPVNLKETKMQIPSYFRRGGLTKYQKKGTVVNIPTDPGHVEILKNTKQGLLDYYTARTNFENPEDPERAAQIREDAKQVLAIMNSSPENYQNLIQYRTPRWFAESGVVGRYEPNKKDPSKDIIALYDPRVKNTDDYIKYYYPNDKKAQEYINQNRAMYDDYIKQGNEKYVVEHEGRHKFLQGPLTSVLGKRDYNDLIYNALSTPKTYESLVLKRDSFLNPPEMQGFVVPFSKEQKEEIRKQYGWMAGESQRLNVGNRGPQRGMISNMDKIPFSKNQIQPQEWYQAKQLLYSNFGIDPSKPVTAEQLKQIDEQSYNIYKEASDPDKYHINEHIQDFFDIHGKDYKKLATLLNSVVYNTPNKFLPENTYRGNLSQFSREGGEIEEDKEMVEGIADILSQVKNRQNRNQIAQNMIGDFKRENVKYDLNKFLSMANLMKKGGQMIKRADGSYSRRGLWDNIRANSGSGKKPTPEMLEQERKIRRESKEIGGIFIGQKLFRPRKSSIFANGGMTYQQLYSFLFDGDDEYGEDNIISSNNAPSQSELDQLHAQNKSLIKANESLNRLLLRNKRNSLAMEVINSSPRSSFQEDVPTTQYTGNISNSFTNRQPTMMPMKPQTWGQTPEYINNYKNYKSSSFPNKIYGFAE